MEFVAPSINDGWETEPYLTEEPYFSKDANNKHCVTGSTLVRRNGLRQEFG
jgi:hypothetical protein